MKYTRQTDSHIISWQYVPKITILVFLLYNNWYKEIWGDRPVILYGSVIILTASLFVPYDDNGHQRIEIRSIPLLFKVLFCFGIYCLISGIFVCYNRTDFISSMITYFCFLVVLFDCCIIAQRDGNWDWLLKCMILVAIVCCVYTILFGYSRQSGGAVTTTLGLKNNPHLLAYVFLIGIFSLSLDNKEGQITSLNNLLLIMLLSYAIVLTGSRKTLIALLLFFIVWILSSLKEKGRVDRSLNIGFYIGLLFAICLAILFFFNYYKGSDQFLRLMRLFDDGDDSSIEQRKEMYDLAIKLWKENPVFGVGFNQYKFYSWRGDYSHSIYGEVLSCTGTIGFFILFVPIIYSLRGMFIKRQMFEGVSKYRLTICITGFVIEFILGIGQIWIYSITHELFLISILGAYESISENATKKARTNIAECYRCKYLR